MPTALDEKRDDIIAEVCLRSGFKWVEGEYLVERTERENAALLRKKKNPLSMFLSALAIGIGAFWALISFVGLITPIFQIWQYKGWFTEGFTLNDDFWLNMVQILAGVILVIIGIIELRRAMRSTRGLTPDDIL
jgi:hypothetical protein